MRNLFLSVAITAALLTTAAKAETINCTEITVVPFVITAQGVYCLKRDQSSALTTGNIIDIQANNVTIDLNGFKLGGLGAGTATNATGISATDRQNITIRNGSVRGFLEGIHLEGSSSSGHLVEDVLLDTNRAIGIEVGGGTGNVIRNNRVVNTGPSDNFTGATGIAVRGNNTVVADNIVSGTKGTILGSGIAVASATLVELRNNSILNTSDATNNFGIQVTASTDTTVLGNRILNPVGSGTQGINVSGSSGINCIANTVAGFATAVGACNFTSGNITP